MKLHQNARKFLKIRKFKTFENVKRLGFEFLASYATRMNSKLFQWAINSIYRFTTTELRVSKWDKIAYNWDLHTILNLFVSFWSAFIFISSTSGHQSMATLNANDCFKCIWLMENPVNIQDFISVFKRAINKKYINPVSID